MQAPERSPQPQPGAVSPGGRCGPARACAVLTAAPRRPPPARDLLLRPAQPAQERLHGAAAVHAGQPGHAPGARPAPRAHQGQHVPDLLVQQGPLPLPDQRLLAAAARWVRLGRWKCVCVHEGVCLRARVKFALVYPAVLPPFLWHLFSKQLLCDFEKSSSDHRPKVTSLRWQWVPGEKWHLLSGSVALMRPFPQLAVLLCACRVSCDTCFPPCPWGLPSSC